MRKLLTLLVLGFAFATPIFSQSFEGRIVKIENVHSGKALCTLHNSQDPANIGNQEPMIQYDYYGDATQKWEFRKISEGIYALINIDSGKALCTLHNSQDPLNKGNQEPMIQYNYYGDSTQHWRVKKAGRGIFILENVHSGKALCTLHNSQDPLNKGNQEPMIQYDYYGDSTQQWKISIAD
jgi:hypothetical protein